MDYTPDSAIHLQRSKKHLYHGSSCDSGYSGLQSFSGKPSGAKFAPCRFLSPEDYNETPKENLSVSPMKERTSDTPRLVEKDFRRVQPPPGSWCETPKASNKDGLLRRRILACNDESTTDAKTEAPGSPCAKVTDTSPRLGAKHRFAGSSDTPDDPFGTLSYSASKPSLDRSPLSTRKRRLFFAQVKTSTHDCGRNSDGNLQRNVSLSSDADLSDSVVSSGRCTTDQLATPLLGKFLPALERETCQTPDNMAAAISGQSPCAQNTPSAALTPTYVRSVSEDSGFGSVAHDKSHDSSLEHDGSFQELLPPSSSPRSKGKRRSRLQRQQRLSTLREGGSQSEEDGRHVGQARPGGLVHLTPVDEVFLVADTTPSGSAALKPGGRATPLGPISAKQDTATPLRRTPTARRDATAPASAEVAGRNATTPLRSTPAGLESLSLTPALQLVGAMCLRKASLMQGQTPSFEREMRSAVALVETPVAIRTSMPLAGLIGRKMGVGRLDVLTELKKRNLRHILAVILNHLAPEVLHRFGQVSRSWNEIIGQDKRASSRRKSHLIELEAALEHGGVVRVTDAETRLALIKRVVLGSTQAQSRSSSYGTPQSAKSTLTPSQQNTSHSGGSTSIKREKFLQVAKTLFSDEFLKPCPRCQHPAKCHPVKLEGVCSRTDCTFRFCTACLCTFHGARECLSRSVGRRRDTAAPGSAQSKRNLRRL